MSTSLSVEPAHPIATSSTFNPALIWSAAFFCYALFMHWMYVDFLQPAFYFDLRVSPNANSPLIGAAFCALTSLAVPKTFRKPSDIVLFFAFALHIVSVQMVATHYDMPVSYNLVVALSFAIICAIAEMKPVKVGTVDGGKALFLLMAGSCVAITVGLGILSGELSPASLSYSNIYDLRMVSDEVSRGGLTEYLSVWTVNLFTMMFFTISLLKRKYLAAGLLLMLQMALFTTTHEKLTLFVPFFSLLAYWAFERGFRPVQLIASLIGLVALGSLLSEQYNFQLLNLIVVRRVYFVPATLDALYVQTFDIYGLQYWSQFLSRFGVVPSGPPPAVVVGALLANSAGTLNNAGTGYIGSGYMQAGYPGMLIYACLIGTICYTVNTLAYGRVRTSLAAAISFYPIWTALNDTDLPATLLTQGILIAIMGLFMLGGRAEWPPMAEKAKPPDTSEKIA